MISDAQLLNVTVMLSENDRTVLEQGLLLLMAGECTCDPEDTIPSEDYDPSDHHITDYNQSKGRCQRCEAAQLYEYFADEEDSVLSDTERARNQDRRETVLQAVLLLLQETQEEDVPE